MNQDQKNPQPLLEAATATMSKPTPMTVPSSTPEAKQPAKPAPVPLKIASERRLPVLRFSPTAWAKLLFFRDRQENEIGGFAVSAADDLLRVEDFATVRQDATMASVSFDDQAVAEFFEAQVDAGRKPQQFCRTWLHTHPGDSPEPSATDEATFSRVFGRCDWAVLFVLARGGKSYARLRFNVGPGGQVLIPVEVDYRGRFGPSDQAAWEAEYRANIHARAWSWDIGDNRPLTEQDRPSQASFPDDWLAELEAMEPAERQAIMDELSARPDLWNQETEAYCDY